MGKRKEKNSQGKKKGEGVVAFPFLRLSMSHAKPGEASEVVGTLASILATRNLIFFFKHAVPLIICKSSAVEHLVGVVVG